MEFEFCGSVGYASEESMTQFSAFSDIFVIKLFNEFLNRKYVKKVGSEA